MYDNNYLPTRVHWLKRLTKKLPPNLSCRQSQWTIVYNQFLNNRKKIQKKTLRNYRTKKNIRRFKEPIPIESLLRMINKAIWKEEIVTWSRGAYHTWSIDMLSTRFASIKLTVTFATVTLPRQQTDWFRQYYETPRKHR